MMAQLLTRCNNTTLWQCNFETLVYVFYQNKKLGNYSDIPNNFLSLNLVARLFLMSSVLNYESFGHKDFG